MMNVQNSLLRATVGVSIIYISYIFMFFLLLLFSFLFNLNILEIESDSLTYDPIPFFVTTTIPMIFALIVAPILYETKVGGANLREIGLSKKSENKGLQYAVYLISFITIVYILINNPITSLPVLAHFTVSCFGEEILFRGILQRRMAEHMPIFIAILVSSLIFALGFHSDSSIQDNLLIRFPLSFVFGYIFYKTKNIFPVFILHLAYNMLVSF